MPRPPLSPHTCHPITAVAGARCDRAARTARARGQQSNTCTNTACACHAVVCNNMACCVMQRASVRGACCRASTQARILTRCVALTAALANRIMFRNTSKQTNKPASRKHATERQNRGVRTPVHTYTYACAHATRTCAHGIARPVTRGATTMRQRCRTSSSGSCVGCACDARAGDEGAQRQFRSTQ